MYYHTYRFYSGTTCADTNGRVKDFNVMAVIGMRGMGIIDDVEGMTFSTSRQGECAAGVNVRIVQNT